MKLIEIKPDNSTSGYTCERPGTDFFQTHKDIEGVKSICGDRISKALINNGVYIGSCTGEKCLFDKT